MPTEDELLNEEEASHLWERAAQLQAKAASEEALGSDEGAGESAPAGVGEYSLVEARAVAQEVGIADKFIDAALASLRMERALPAPPQRRTLARRFFNTLLDAIIVQRVIDAPLTQVLSVIDAAFPEAPYQLHLRERRGDPLSGGILVYDIQGLEAAPRQGLASEVYHAEVRHVYVLVREIGEAGRSCEITLASPIASSHPLGVIVGGVATSIGGGVGFGAGSAVGSGLSALAIVIGLGVVAPVVAAGAAVGGVVAGGVIGRSGLLKLCAVAQARARRAFEGLLSAVAARAENVSFPDNPTTNPRPDPE